MINVLPAVPLDRKTAVNLHLRRPIYRQHQFDNGHLIAKKSCGVFLKSDLPDPAKTLNKKSLLDRLEKNTFEK